MTEKKYRVHDLVKFQYSEICEYSGENYTDRPLRNDEIVDLLNEQHETIQVLKVSDGEMEDYLARLEEENELLKIDKQQLNMAMSRENVRHKEFRDKVFGLIDAKIKEYQKYEEYDTEKYYIATTTLKELKKELIE